MTKQQYLKQWLTKAYLIFLEKDPPRTHSLELLIEALRSASPDVSDYDVGDLTAYAVQARYPDELIEPDTAEVRQYAELAEKVLNDVRVRIGV